AVARQYGLARQVWPQVRVEAGHAAAAEEALLRKAYDERESRLVALDAVELPAADEAVNPAALVQEAPALAERELDQVVDDEDVRRVVRRDGAQAAAIAGYLDQAARGRAAEEVFRRVRDELREGVRGAELYAVRVAALEL